MVKMSFSVPRSPIAGRDFGENAIRLSNENAVAWGIPTPFLEDINAKSDDFELKQSVAGNRRTQFPAATASRNAAWILLRVALIYLYDHYILNNDAIPVITKEALHIHFSDGRKTPTPEPTTTPQISLTTFGISILKVIFSDITMPGIHAKPANVAFCQLNYKVDVPPPAGPEDCPESISVSRSNLAITFKSDQRGKQVFAFARWINKNGKVGPWSGMITAFIP